MMWSVAAWAMNPEFPQAAVCEWPTADLVLPGSGLDHVTLGDGDDTLVVMGGCELAAGETFEGGNGADVLVAPLSACDLARRGVAATGFERWVRTTAVSDGVMCRTPVGRLRC
jgi:hypothetical protein